MSRLHEQYSNQIKDAMMKKFEYSNIMQVPKLEKIVINMGVGEAKENKKVLEYACGRQQILQRLYSLVENFAFLFCFATIDFLAMGTLLTIS